MFILFYSEVSVWTYDAYYCLGYIFICLTSHTLLTVGATSKKTAKQIVFEIFQEIEFKLLKNSSFLDLRYDKLPIICTAVPRVVSGNSGKHTNKKQILLDVIS